MKKHYIKNLLVGLSFIIILSSAIMSASGPGGGYSNAPNESNCTSCHSGSIITSGNSNLNNLRLKGNFHGSGYLPDSTYVIEITYKQSGKSKFGFEVTALDNSNSPAGTLNSTNSRTSKTTANVSGKTRQYIQHTSTGTSSVGTDSTRWTFEWKAPSSNVGPVTFYVVINSTNSDNSTSGDQIYGKTFQVGLSNLLPVAQASSQDSVTCLGYNVQLSGSGTNSPTSYSWKLTGANPSSSNSQNPVVTYASPGTKQAILTVTNSYGSSAPDTLNIIVNQSPSAVILNGSAGSVCKGDSLLLSANTGANITYEWLHNNAKTRTVWVKDSLSYQVKVTSTVNACVRTSNPFKLNWYDDPSISISKQSSSDSFCNSYNETFTASGNLIDSVHWYVNGVLTRRTKSLSTTFTGQGSILVHALAKSINKCLSAPSNSIRITSVPALYPTNFSSSKTTSTINLRWKKTGGISAYLFAVDGSGFSATTSDSSLELSGLQPNTTYNIKIRSMQNSPCLFADTGFFIKTNACSNLAYSLDFNPRTCLGNSLTATVKGLYNAKYSISFDGSGFGTDTVYMFTPTQSDSLRILINDSLSPTCPAIEETVFYQIDTLFDKDTADGFAQISLCSSAYTMLAKPGYSSYEFYKNGILAQTGSQNSYNFTGLVTGDKLTVKGIINTCSRIYGPVEMTINQQPNSGFTYTRSWKTYRFTADDQTLSTYSWKVGSTIIGNTADFSKDMSTYNDSDIDVVLLTESAAGCRDSSTQTITVPNMNSVLSIHRSPIKIYPNPFGETIKIKHDLSQYQIHIYDSQGRLQYAILAEDGEQDVNTQEWAAGVYQVLISDSDGHVYQAKIVKQ